MHGLMAVLHKVHENKAWWMLHWSASFNVGFILSCYPSLKLTSIRCISFGWSQPLPNVTVLCYNALLQGLLSPFSDLQRISFGWSQPLQNNGMRVWAGKPISWRKCYNNVSSLTVCTIALYLGSTLNRATIACFYSST